MMELAPQDIADGHAGPCASRALVATSAACCIILLLSSLLSPSSLPPSICLLCTCTPLPQHPMAASYVAPRDPRVPSSLLAHICSRSLTSALTRHVCPHSPRPPSLATSTLARHVYPRLPYLYTPPMLSCSHVYRHPRTVMCMSVCSLALRSYPARPLVHAHLPRMPP
ncbi:hypothetical protein EVG20_g9683 [Dentipellis fragilis]|uniref:Uncharacterized protein n=1 Tax=Dentipellis fragilis TaxID=205917 RepID=A0A4Y9XW57_9AGAM|nr:hypothetical protein EVG20_g9683 [Dentipellis fragilis]